MKIKNRILKNAEYGEDSTFFSWIDASSQEYGHDMLKVRKVLELEIIKLIGDDDVDIFMELDYTKGLHENDDERLTEDDDWRIFIKFLGLNIDKKYIDGIISKLKRFFVEK
jgi:hypothetical protein